MYCWGNFISGVIASKNGFKLFDECDRMAGLVKLLGDFYRPSMGTFTFVKIEDVIDDILLINQKRLKTLKISIEKFYGDKVPVIKVIPDQIKQVFLNIITNACDAMLNGGGKITICTKLIDSNVAIHISDTGAGISDENIVSIFEPFFSTKFEVKGTGLGLSVCYGIIKNHYGDIKVQSQIDKKIVLQLLFLLTIIN